MCCSISLAGHDSCKDDYCVVHRLHLYFLQQLACFVHATASLLSANGHCFAICTLLPRPECFSFMLVLSIISSPIVHDSNN